MKIDTLLYILIGTLIITCIVVLYRLYITPEFFNETRGSIIVVSLALFAGFFSIIGLYGYFTKEIKQNGK